jgi:hypothetical protein
MWVGLLGTATFVTLVVVIGGMMICKVVMMSEEELKGEVSGGCPAPARIVRKPISPSTPTLGQSERTKAE